MVMSFWLIFLPARLRAYSIFIYFLVLDVFEKIHGDA